MRRPPRTTFYLTVFQDFSSDAYVQTLLSELATIGIEGRLVSAEDSWTAVTRLDDVM
ncbi:MAG: hypothetical protein Q4B54_07245 [Coriobacteriales bacterium]|nr:hypothetical protein [Coriobacteriales bacterium]